MLGSVWPGGLLSEGDATALWRLPGWASSLIGSYRWTLTRYHSSLSRDQERRVNADVSCQSRDSRRNVTGTYLS